MTATDNRRVGRADRVADLIQANILSGDFAPGQRLVESELSETFNSSRGAVRSALIDLTHEGLVERIANRGARVRTVSVEEAVALTEVRMVVEGLCAAKGGGECHRRPDRSTARHRSPHAGRGSQRRNHGLLAAQHRAARPDLRDQRPAGRRGGAVQPPSPQRAAPVPARPPPGDARTSRFPSTWPSSTRCARGARTAPSAPRAVTSPASSRRCTTPTAAGRSRPVDDAPPA